MVTTMCLCLPVAADKPVPASLKVDGTKMSIQWQARAGVAYQLQGSNDRVNWKNHGGIRVGPTANSAPIGRSYRYYRVMELKNPLLPKRLSRGAEGKTLTAAKKPKLTKVIPEKLIADPIVEEAIRTELNKPTGEVTRRDLAKITELELLGTKLPAQGCDP